MLSSCWIRRSMAATGSSDENAEVLRNSAAEAVRTGPAAAAGAAAPALVAPDPKAAISSLAVRAICTWSVLAFS